MLSSRDVNNIQAAQKKPPLAVFQKKNTNNIQAAQIKKPPLAVFQKIITYKLLMKRLPLVVFQTIITYKLLWKRPPLAIFRRKDNAQVAHEETTACRFPQKR